MILEISKRVITLGASLLFASALCAQNTNCPTKSDLAAGISLSQGQERSKVIRAISEDRVAYTSKTLRSGEVFEKQGTLYQGLISETDEFARNGEILRVVNRYDEKLSDIFTLKIGQEFSSLFINCVEGQGCSSDGGNVRYKILREETAVIGNCQYPSLVIFEEFEVYHYYVNYSHLRYIPELKLVYAAEEIDVSGAPIKEIYRYTDIKALGQN